MGKGGQDSGMSPTQNQQTADQQLLHSAQCAKLVPQMASMLTQLAQRSASHPSAQPTPFDGAKVPPMPLLDYLRRFGKYSQASPECFMYTLIFIDRYLEATGYLLTPLNVHRLCIASFCIAAKVRDDFFFSNRHFAAIGGVPNQELNVLEREMLSQLGMEMFVGEEEYAAYVAVLRRHHERERRHARKLAWAARNNAALADDQRQQRPGQDGMSPAALPPAPPPACVSPKVPQPPALPAGCSRSPPRQYDASPQCPSPAQGAPVSPPPPQRAPRPPPAPPVSAPLSCRDGCSDLFISAQKRLGRNMPPGRGMSPPRQGLLRKIPSCDSYGSLSGFGSSIRSAVPLRTPSHEHGDGASASISGRSSYRSCGATDEAPTTDTISMDTPAVGVDDDAEDGAAHAADCGPAPFPLCAGHHLSGAQHYYAGALPLGRRMGRHTAEAAGAQLPTMLCALRSVAGPAPP